ncbi:MAG: TauD/TfdA family dioxygenase [Hyphomonadaceae bacterium]|nr:TauD/TfdA family dioxygenase [Hyphomonadaceae bacterium]
MEIARLHPLFAAELIGADLAQPPDSALVSLVEEAMAEHAVLVIRGQAHIGDDEHIRFSRAFGPLELPSRGGGGGPAKRFREELFDASNLDANGDILAPDARARQRAKRNEIFHTDSSFHDMPTKWSLLLGHVVTSGGGETEFADCRAAYEALPQTMRDRIAGLVAEHNILISRSRAGYKGDEPLKDAIAPVRHALVRRSASGRPTLYLGAHADHIVGMDIDEGRALLQELVEFATQPQFVYRHEWSKGDLVIWDNRCTLHRAAPFAGTLTLKRDLRRTTINEYGEERAAMAAGRAAASA